MAAAGKHPSTRAPCHSRRGLSSHSNLAAPVRCVHREQNPFTISIQVHSAASSTCMPGRVTPGQINSHPPSRSDENIPKDGQCTGKHANNQPFNQRSETGVDLGKISEPEPPKNVPAFVTQARHSVNRPTQAMPTVAQRQAQQCPHLTRPPTGTAGASRGAATPQRRFQIGLEISMIAPCACTPYSGSTPALPPTVKSLGDARLVSTTRHHLWPAGGAGSVARTSTWCALNAKYRSPQPGEGGWRQRAQGKRAALNEERGRVVNSGCCSLANLRWEKA